MLWQPRIDPGRNWRTCVMVILWACAGVLNAAETPDAQMARTVLDATDFGGGLVVHLGCRDGRFTAGLRSGENCLVHGLDPDPVNVEKSRKYIRSLGMYRQVSVDRLNGDRLPYADNLVNLLVAEDLGAVSKNEVMRVLAPNGVAYLKEDGRWKLARKPWPAAIDQWTHYLHDASGNAVGNDALAGPPRYMQWVAAPLWPRSHEHTPSIPAMVSANGRIIYLMDDGIRGIRDTRLPERWALYARDAFSGVRLWRVPVPGWGGEHWKSHAHWSSPMSLPRRLVAAGDRVFFTRGYRGPVNVVDARTGNVLKQYPETANTEEILWTDGVLLLRRRKAIPDYPRGATAWNVQVRRKAGKKTPKEWTELPPASAGDETIAAMDAETGKIIWQFAETRIVTLSLASSAGRVCYHNFDAVVCLDLKTGKELWRAACKTWPDLTGTSGTLVMYKGMVFYAGDRGIHAWSAETGKLLWKGPRIIRSAPRQPPDLFLAGGLLWGGLTGQMNPGHLPGEESPAAATPVTGTAVLGMDPVTGEIRKKIDIGNLVSTGHHVRCYRGKATDRYLLWPKRGVEFVDIATGRNHVRCDWFRGECSYGVMPSGGLIYAPPHPCICYLGAKLEGFNALAATRTAVPAESNPVRLERGPAYGERAAREQRLGGEGDWPTYRHDPARSGFTKTGVPAALQKKWVAEPGGRLSAPVSAAARVFVASVDTHTVHALDAGSGKRLWNYTAGGRVDSPPTVYRDLVLFGCRDGWVYCLRASDGALAWRFRAAPTDTRIVAFEQVESAWPIPGSILVQEGVAYFAAGRSSFLDGGMYLYALDAQSGEVLHARHLDGPWPDIAKDKGLPYHMEGAKSDILTSDGESIYLLYNRFDRKLGVQPTPATTEAGTRPVGLHLMARSGFLDDTWFDRVFWLYDSKWLGRVFRPNAPGSGQILVFDDTTLYALRGFPEKHFMSPSFTPGTGYVLRADDIRSDGAVTKRGQNVPGAKWSAKIPVRAHAMVLADDTLLLAGPPDVVPAQDPYAAWEGRRGAMLWAVSAADGKKLSEYKLDACPVFDGMIAANGKMYLSLDDGSLECWSASTQ